MSEPYVCPKCNQFLVYEIDQCSVRVDGKCMDCKKKEKQNEKDR